MANVIRITFSQLKPNERKEDVIKAKDYFQEWAAEGGLQEDFNPALKAEHGLNVILMDNGADWFELQVYRVSKLGRK